MDHLGQLTADRAGDPALQRLVRTVIRAADDVRDPERRGRRRRSRAGRSRVPSARRSVTPSSRSEPSASRVAPPVALGDAAGRRVDVAALALAQRALVPRDPEPAEVVAGSPPRRPAPSASRSVSSIRARAHRRCSSAKRRFATAVSALPRCSEPVGLGAKRTRTRDASGVDRHVPRLGCDAIEPGPDRRVAARGRSRPRRRRACTRRARCRRAGRDADEVRPSAVEVALHRVERAVAPRLRARSRRRSCSASPEYATRNRTTAIAGSCVYCSKNIHCSTFARS